LEQVLALEPELALELVLAFEPELALGLVLVLELVLALGDRTQHEHEYWQQTQQVRVKHERYWQQ
jgi:hypothetical protein